MVEVLINNYYGGFGVKKEILSELYPDKRPKDCNREILRWDKRLIALVKEKGSKAVVEEPHELTIEVIPQIYYDMGAFRIDEYDGLETLHLSYFKLKCFLLEERN